MPFQKGKPKTGGKTKGTPNKVTQTFREAVANFLELSQDEFLNWLKEMDSPKDRFDAVCKLAEYAHPKFSRIEHTGKDGNPIEHQEITPEDLTNAIKTILGNSSST